MAKTNDEGDFDFAGADSRQELECPDVANVNSVWTAVLVEGLLVGLAIGFSFLGLFDHGQYLSEMSKALLVSWKGASWLLAGVASSIPLIVCHWIIEKTQPAFYQPMRRLVENFFYPMFARSSWVELLIVSLVAGFGEELFFRWCLQGGISSMLASSLAPWAVGSISILAAGVAFGLCHFVSNTYFIMATVAGIYFGVVMVVFDSWVVAAVAHALFDLYALIKIRSLKLAID